MKTDSYVSGEYFAEASRFEEDAAFKAEHFRKLFLRHKSLLDGLRSYADIGCGAGEIVRINRDFLRSQGFTKIQAYDISPHILNLEIQGVETLCEDFSCTSTNVDLITLFDVVEHVLCPVEFLKAVMERGHVVILHIPLDEYWLALFRNQIHTKLQYGDVEHLSFFRLTTALNILAESGIRVVDFEFTPIFKCESLKRSVLQRLLNPLRAILFKVSPWLVSHVLGGVSLLVIGVGAKHSKALHGLKTVPAS